LRIFAPVTPRSAGNGGQPGNRDLPRELGGTQYNGRDNAVVEWWVIRVLASSDG
jgi:hypothetical protein